MPEVSSMPATPGERGDDQSADGRERQTRGLGNRRGQEAVLSGRVDETADDHAGVVDPLDVSVRRPGTLNVV